MSTVAIRIDMPPKGIEVNGEGSSPTDDQMAEEQAARDQFMELIAPALSSLPERPPRRTGNVSRVQLLGANTWSNLNHYLVLVDSDGEVGPDLESVLPADAKVEVIGAYGGLMQWPEAAPAG
jgi:hypothetical protein